MSDKDNVVTCPECGSTNIYAKSKEVNTYALIAEKTGVWLGEEIDGYTLVIEYHCEDCLAEPTEEELNEHIKQGDK